MEDGFREGKEDGVAGAVPEPLEVRSCSDEKVDEDESPRRLSRAGELMRVEAAVRVVR